MTIYLVIVEDCHSDVEVTPFRQLESAIKFADDYLSSMEGDGERHELTPGMAVSGWMYYATYSVEGDSVVIVERELR